MLKMFICTKRYILEVFSANPKIELKVNRDFQLFNDIGHFSDVENRACTKILETVPNPDTFVGEPPHTAGEPPLAVAKEIQTSIYFSLIIILSI
jgi:hypothetical protein